MRRPSARCRKIRGPAQQPLQTAFAEALFPLGGFCGKTPGNRQENFGNNNENASRFIAK
jgi:hypothetical protein